MNLLSQKDRWELPPLLLNLLESHGFKRNMHAKMYLLDTIASAIPPCPPTTAVDVNHRTHKPGNSRLRAQVWVFVCYQHSGGHLMCYGTSAGLPEQGVPFRLVSPCSLQPTSVASPGSSWGLGGFSLKWSLSHQPWTLCTLYLLSVADHRGSTFNTAYFSLLDRYYPYLCAWIWWSFKPGIGGLVKKTGQKVC